MSTPIQATPVELTLALLDKMVENALKALEDRVERIEARLGLFMKGGDS